MSAPTTQVRERPTLFSAPMVRAILDGRKTVTRRVVKPQPEHRQVYDWKGRRLHDSEYRVWCWRQHVGADNWADITEQLGHACPYGAPGDRLWVRETWREEEEDPNEGTHHTYRWVHYRATPHWGYRVAPDRARCTYLHESAEPERVAEQVAAYRWRPSIFMPRYACRLVLEVVSVRVERLQDITEADAVAEGITVAEGLNGIGVPGSGGLDDGYDCARDCYADLWDDLNARRPLCQWDTNPWVWVVGFRRCEP